MNQAEETRLKELVHEARTEAIRAYVTQSSDRLKQVVKLLNEADRLLSGEIDLNALAGAEVVWMGNE